MNKNIRDRRHMRERKKAPFVVMRSSDTQHIFYNCDRKYINVAVTALHREAKEIQKNHHCSICHQDNKEKWSIYRNASLFQIMDWGLFKSSYDLDEAHRINSRIGVILPYEVMRHNIKPGVNDFVFPKIDFGVYRDGAELVITAETIEDAMEIALSY